MTSLPISLPKGYSPLVKKGDAVTLGQPLAKDLAKTQNSQEDETLSSEVIMDLPAALDTNASAVRKFLRKGPGDSLTIGETVAEKSAAMGLKKQLVLSDISGTVVRFERDSGKLYVRTEDLPTKPAVSHDKLEILSPLAGKISVCNNEQIVIETESKALEGTVGFGGRVTGEIMILSPQKDQSVVASMQVSKDAIGKILLLPDIAIEALVKADAIGVGGILATEVSEQLVEFISSHKLGLPVISIDPTVGKKLVKIKNPVTIHGDQKSILFEE